jgi:DNA-binding transcriptional LysR family regulator
VRPHKTQDSSQSAGSTGLRQLIQQIELRQLRYVVAVSDDLHFSRAADRLHLAAPSLSKQIRQLEGLLGYPLFHRGTRQVQLTEAGTAFVEEARQALTHVTFALSKSAEVHGAQSGIVVGYSPWVDLSWLIDARNQLKNQVGAQVRLQSEYSASQIEGLLAGRLAAGVVILPIEESGLTVHVIRQERLVVALADDNPIASSEAVTLGVLADQPFISMRSGVKPALYSHLKQVCGSSGFAPNIAYEVSSFAETLELVSMKYGIALVRSSAVLRLQYQGVTFRECSTPDCFVEVGLAYRSEHPPPSVETFVSLLRGPNP